MKYKLSWIGWVTISLLALSLTFAVFAFSGKLEIIKSNYTSSLIFLAPMVLFGIAVTVSIFRRIKADRKNYWLLDDLCTRINIMIFVCYLVWLVLPLFVKNTLFYNNSSTLDAFWQTTSLQFFIFISLLMFNKIIVFTRRKIRLLPWLISFGFLLLIIFYLILQIKEFRFIYFLLITNSLLIILTMVFVLFLNNKVLEKPFIFLVWGLAVSNILALGSCFVSADIPLAVYTITALSTINIATDINLSLNPKENSVNPENKWRQDEN